MVKIGIIIGSTRPGRAGEGVAKWIYEMSKARSDAEFELVDVKDYDLPLLDEPELAATQKYSKEHTKKWSAKIAEFDGYIFVTPEYNHSTSAALKNALDFLYIEWTNKAAGFVSYGAIGGARAVEALRTIMAQFKIADVREQVMFFNADDFENGVLKPKPRHEKSVNTLFDQVIAWSTALKTLR
jgi:NAD(P)H-dependent FMN reductase